MARLFNDGSGITYNATTGSFESVPFGNIVVSGAQQPNPNGFYERYDYVSLANFQMQVDNSMAGLMRDCGECHVGGGGMEYVPRNARDWKSKDLADRLRPSDRESYRFINYGTTVTAYNYFIDVFDENGNGDTTEVLVQNYNKSGVMEVDCLVCHLEGYDWAAAKASKRAGQFDVSRVTGAGFGSPSYSVTPNPTADSGITSANDSIYSNNAWGRAVDYDPAVVNDAGAFVWVDLSQSIKKVPPKANCAACHQATHQVDWKKRGEENPSYGVHYGMGCMGCHQRKEPENIDEATGASKLNILGHDPAKGYAGPWDNLANKQDNVDFKECIDCHTGSDLGSIGESYGAPGFGAAHADAGLSAPILQTGRDGTANASHIDIIACQSCHVTKSDGSTGGAFVDGTGPDHEGRLADHDNPYVGRTMEGNFGYNWGNDKMIHPGNFLTSFFLRDKNDNDYDVNNDGRAGGMDALLQTHIAKALDNGGSGSYTSGIFSDGIVNQTEITDMLSYYNSSAFRGINKLDAGASVGAGSAVKLSFLTVPFTMSHNIDPSHMALGVGGCTDCHAAASDGPTHGGIFNRVVEMSGDSDISWAASQLTPMTKVNAMSQITFSHPKVRDKWLVRSLPLVLHKGAPDTPANGTEGLRDVLAGESLYEATFMTRARFTNQPIVGTNLYLGPDSNPVSWPSGTGTTNGFWLKIEACLTSFTDAECAEKDSTGKPVNAVWRTAVAKGSTTGIDDLLATLAAFGGNYTNSWEFTITTADFDASAATGDTVSGSGNDHFVITPDPGYKIRIHPYSNAGGVELAGKPTFGYGVLSGVYEAAPITPTCQNTDLNGGFSELTGRADMLAYLNALGAPSVNYVGKTQGEECLGMVPPDKSLIEPTITAATETGGNGMVYYVATAGTPVTITRDDLPGYTYSTYLQDIADNSDSGDPIVGTSFTCPTSGTYAIVTEATNIEGKLVKDVQYVDCLAQLVGDFLAPTISVDGGTGAITVTLNLGGTAPVYTDALVNWADDTAQDHYEALEALTNVYPASFSGQTVRVNVAFYDIDGSVLDAWATDIVLP